VLIRAGRVHATECTAFGLLLQKRARQRRAISRRLDGRSALGRFSGTDSLYVRDILPRSLDDDWYRPCQVEALSDRCVQRAFETVTPPMNTVEDRPPPVQVSDLANLQPHVAIGSSAVLASLLVGDHPARPLASWPQPLL